MPPTSLPPWVVMFLSFLKLTPLEPLATAIEKDFADGKIDVGEAGELVMIATEKAAELYPAGAPELHFANEVATSFVKYWNAKHPAEAPIG